MRLRRRDRARRGGGQARGPRARAVQPGLRPCQARGRRGGAAGLRGNGGAGPGQRRGAAQPRGAAREGRGGRGGGERRRRRQWREGRRRRCGCCRSAPPPTAGPWPPTTPPSPPRRRRRRRRPSSRPPAATLHARAVLRDRLGVDAEGALRDHAAAAAADPASAALARSLGAARRAAGDLDGADAALSRRWRWSPRRRRGLAAGIRAEEAGAVSGGGRGLLPRTRGHLKERPELLLLLLFHYSLLSLLERRTRLRLGHGEASRLSRLLPRQGGRPERGRVALRRRHRARGGGGERGRTRRGERRTGKRAAAAAALLPTPRCRTPGTTAASCSRGGATTPPPWRTSTPRWPPSAPLSFSSAYLFFGVGNSPNDGGAVAALLFSRGSSLDALGRFDEAVTDYMRALSVGGNGSKNGGGKQQQQVSAAAEEASCDGDFSASDFFKLHLLHFLGFSLQRLFLCECKMKKKELL